MQGLRFSACVAGLAMLAVACSSKNAPIASETTSAMPVSASEDPAAMPTGDATTEASAATIEDTTVDIANDLYEFQYSYPAAAAAVPELKARLDARSKQALASLTAAARTDQRSAKTDGYTYFKHAYSTTWKVVTDLPGWLSLSAEGYEFTGGAHGMSHFDALLWNRKTGKTEAPSDLFVSGQALSTAVRDRFCKALDNERAERRNGADMSGTDFTECIDPLRQTILPGSSNGQTFDRIGFLIAPYEAGPYAEGSYEITLPVDAAVMRALRPQYRSSFSIPR